MLQLLDKNINSNFVDIETGLKVHYLECNYTNKKDAPIALLLPVSYTHLTLPTMMSV